jgi:hypothetical protein
MNKRDIHVGDLVVEVAGNHAGALRSGSTSYACAICVSADPFVLASEEGDMLWHNADKSKLMAWRAATADEARQAFNRFHKRGQWAPDYKTNPNSPHQFPTVAEFKLEDRVRVNWPGDGGYTVYEIPLKSGMSPDQTIFDFVTGRGLLAKMLQWQFRQGAWADQNVRMTCLVTDLLPIMPEGKTLTIYPDGRWELNDAS